MAEKIKSTTPLISQMVLRNLGMYSSSYLGNDIYFLIEAINLMVSDVGEEFLKEELKKENKDWDEIKKKLDILNKQIMKVKIFYDPIQDKKFEKKSVDKEINKTQAMFKKFFIKTASKISIKQRDLYDLFVFLVKNTTIQRQQIPSEAFKILEHTGFRKIDLSKRPGIPAPSSSEGIVKE